MGSMLSVCSFFFFFLIPSFVTLFNLKRVSTFWFPKFYGNGQDVMAWLKESARLSETNQWDNDKRYDMLTDNLEGDAKEWFTKNKDNMKNFDQLKEGLINQYKDTKELILLRLIHTIMKESESVDTYANRFSEAVEKYLNFCQKEGSEQDLNLKDILLNMVNNISPLTTKHAVLPLSSEIDRVIGQEKDMNSVSNEKFEDIVTSVINFALANRPVNIVKEIASTPPSQEFSDAFFKLCVVGACSGMVTMKLYKYDNYRQELFYDSLDEYLQNNFVLDDGELNFDPMQVIGYLLLCCVPDYYSPFVASFRMTLKATGILEADIDDSDLSLSHKKEISEMIKYWNKENAKICGYVMNAFMTRCGKNMALPDVDFLTIDTNVLKADELASLDVAV